MFKILILFFIRYFDFPSIFIYNPNNLYDYYTYKYYFESHNNKLKSKSDNDNNLKHNTNNNDNKLKNILNSSNNNLKHDLDNNDNKLNNNKFISDKNTNYYHILSYEPIYHILSSIIPYQLMPIISAIFDYYLSIINNQPYYFILTTFLPSDFVSLKLLISLLNPSIQNNLIINYSSFLFSIDQESMQDIIASSGLLSVFLYFMPFNISHLPSINPFWFLKLNIFDQYSFIFYVYQLFFVYFLDCLSVILKSIKNNRKGKENRKEINYKVNNDVKEKSTIKDNRKDKRKDKNKDNKNTLANMKDTRKVLDNKYRHFQKINNIIKFTFNNSNYKEYIFYLYNFKKELIIFLIIREYLIFMFNYSIVVNLNFVNWMDFIFFSFLSLDLFFDI